MYYSYANVMLCKSNIQERNKLHPVGAKRIKEMGKHIVANLHDIQKGLTPHAFFDLLCQVSLCIKHLWACWTLVIHLPLVGPPKL